MYTCTGVGHVERSMTNEIVGLAARTMIIEFTRVGSVIENETRQPSKIAFRPNDGPGTAQSVIRRCMLKLEYCMRAYAHFQSPPSTFDGHKFNNTADVNRTVASLLIDDSDEERGRRCLAKNHSLPPSRSLSLSLFLSFSRTYFPCSNFEGTTFEGTGKFSGGNGTKRYEIFRKKVSVGAIPCQRDSKPGEKERKGERENKFFTAIFSRWVAFPSRDIFQQVSQTSAG